MKFQFFHKPHKAITLKRNKWVDLTFEFGGKTRKRFYADRAGILETALYLPAEFDDGGPTADVVRVRLVRGAFKKQGIDPTGYDERPLLGTDGFARIRFHYVGLAERGRAYHWQAMLLGDASAKVTGTHYAQWWRR